MASTEAGPTQQMGPHIANVNLADAMTAQTVHCVERRKVTNCTGCVHDNNTRLI